MRKKFEELTKDELWSLRQEIIFGSLYISDYRNSFGFTADCICTFFDGFQSHIDERMHEDGVYPPDGVAYYDYLEEYDNAEELWEWRCCFEDFSWVQYEPEED